VFRARPFRARSLLKTVIDLPLLQPGVACCGPRSGKHIFIKMASTRETLPPGLAFPVEGAEAERLVRDVEDEGQFPVHVTGADALEAVTCVLGQRLSGGEAADVLESLPERARPPRCERHRAQRPDRFGRESFIERVGAHLKATNEEAEAIARAVFAVLPRWLPRKEVADVASQLPADLRELWEAPLRVPSVMAPLVSPAPADRLSEAILEEVRASRTLPDNVTASDAVAAGLCTLCQRLSRAEARELLMDLPPGLRPLIERCALHRAEDGEGFGRDEMIGRIARRLNVPPERAEAIARAVFTAVERALPPKEIHDVASELPRDMQALWTDNPVAAVKAPA
jgi:uncharacterized protein (DUF2267 family)